MKLKPKLLLSTIFAVLCLLGLGNLSMQYFVPKLPTYHQKIERYLSEELGAHVHIGQLKSSWRWGLPILVIDNLVVRNEQGLDVVMISEASVGLNWWRSLINWQWQPGFIVVTQPKVILNQIKPIALAAHRWQDLFVLPGMKTGALKKGQTSEQAVLHWLAEQDHILIKNLSLFVKKEGGGILPFSALTLNIANKGTNHHLKLTFHLDQLTKTNVYLIAHLKGQDLTHLQGQLYLHAEEIMPAQWFNFIWGRSYQLTSGKINIDSWLNLKDGRINSTQSTIDALNLGVLNTKSKRRLFFQNFDGRLNSENKNNKQRIILDKIHLRSGDRQLKNNKVIVSQDKQDRTINIKELDLTLLQKILNFINVPPNYVGLDIQSKQLSESVFLKGAARNTEFKFNDQGLSYAKGHVSNLAIKSKKNDFLLKNINFSFLYDKKALSLSLQSKLTYLDAPSFIAKPTYLSALTGELEINQVSKTPQVCWKDFKLKHPFLNFKSAGCLNEINTNAPRINLSFDFSSTHGEKLPSFIPKEGLNAKLTSFLNESVLFAPSIHGHGSWRGELFEFPYLKGTNAGSKGAFYLSANVQDLSMKYHKDWPVAVVYDGNIKVEQGEVAIDLLKGRTLDIPIENVHLNLKKHHQHEQLLMRGSFKTGGKEASQFVKQSALVEDLAFLNYFQIDGPLSVSTQLRFNLDEKKPVRAVFGKVMLKNATASFIKDPSFKVENLSGEVNFFQHGVTNSILQGSLWQSPVTFSLNSENRLPYKMTIGLKSNLLIDNVSKELNLDLSFMKGQMNTELFVEKTPSMPTLNFKGVMDLKKVSVALPAPFYKEENSNKKIEMTGQILHDALTDLTLKIKDELSLRYRQQSSVNKLVIRTAPLQIADWSKTFNSLMTGLKAKPWFQTDNPRDNFQINSEGLFCENFITPPVQISFDSSKLGTEIHLQGKDIDGVISDPNYVKGTIVAKFKKLKLTSNSTNLVSKQEEELTFPDLDLNIKELQIDDLSLGRLNLSTRNRLNAWMIDLFNLENQYNTLKLKGAYTKDKKELTEITGFLQSRNLAETFKMLKKEVVVRSSNGLLRFNLSWRAAPNSLSMEKLKGFFSLMIKKGSITHLNQEMEEKVGIGKLLNILSLQTIPRRLVLDFNDLKMGLPFDKLSAELKADNGNLKIVRAEMNGPVASARLEGALSLIKRSYDVKVYLDPHVTSSLPVVAAIAGGPIAGVATWLVSKVVSSGMKNSKAYAYQIKGPWNDPLINQL